MTWNPFSRKKDEDTLNQKSSEDSATKSVGKGKPTPSRKEAEQAHLNPIVPKDRKASRKAARARTRAREDAEYQAMQSGDIAHMPKAERLPWRVYIRDYVDARYNMGEYFMPFVIVMMVLSLIVAQVYPVLSMGVLIAMYVYFAIVIIDLWWMWRGLKKKLIAKYGEESVKRGSRSGYYAWGRALQIRRWRLPKPRNKKHGVWPK